MSYEHDLSEIGAGLDGIGHVLRDYRLQVPIYQRPYSWEEDQVSAFWGDLRAALLADQDTYFLGTIVLAGPLRERTKTIIDGQQRLVTTSILLAAIRDEFLAAGDASNAEVIQNDLLTFRTVGEERQARLSLNTQDETYFRERVLFPTAETDAKAELASNQRLDESYQFLRQRIREEAEKAKDNWPKLIARWVEYLETHARVIVVQVASEADAFLVFETLNDRGAPLTVADLLKNYLLGRGRDRIDDLESAWLQIISTLDTPQAGQALVDFLRQYWGSLHGATRERDLYRSLRRNIRSQEQAIELTEGLSAAARNYLALITGDVDLWPAEITARDAVGTLQRLRLSQYRPLMLAAMERLGPEQLERLVHAVVAWSVRGVLVGGIGGGTTERYYSAAAVKIRKANLGSAAEVFEQLQEIIPTDDRFRAAALTANVPRTYWARYLLLAYSNWVAGTANPSIVSLEQDSGVAVQRVLPQGGKPELWPSFEEQEIPTFVSRLGNMLLIDPARLVRTQDRTWEDVQAVVRESDGPAAAELDRLDRWDAAAIEGRQEGFAAAAVEIWPRQPS